MAYYKHGIYVEEGLNLYGRLNKINNLELIDLEVNENTQIISKSACKGATKLEHVSLPFGLKQIEGHAFYGCESLQEIHVPSSVEYLGVGAFANRHDRYMLLNTVVFDDVDNSQLRNIDDYAFANCLNLYEIELPNNLTSIGNFSFSNTGIHTITIPDNVEELGCGAFSDCYNLQEINIGKGLKNLGYDTFCNCTNLRHVDIPSNVDYIGYRSFADCTNLESISFDGHTQIDPGAFVNCPSLTTIEISGGVFTAWETPYGDSYTTELFQNIPSLRNVVIKEGVNIIDSNAFRNCHQLDTIHIPNSVMIIGKNAFAGTESEYMHANIVLDNVENSCLKYIGDNAFYACRGIDEAIIPDGCQTIGNNAFCDSGIFQVKIPDSVTSLGKMAFCDCRFLEEVSLGSGLTEISKATFYHCDALQHVDFSNGIAKIGKESFAYCSELNNINLPNSVVTIEERAFSGCSKLSFVSLGEGVKYIESGAFEGCVSLQTITIPSSVEHISSNAFEGCINLKSVVINDQIIQISSPDDLHHLQEIIDAKNEIKSTTSQEVNLLSNLVQDSKAFVVNDNLLCVNSDVSGKLVIDMDVETISPGALKNTNISVVEANESLRHDVAMEEKLFEKHNVDEHQINMDNELNVEL